MRIARFTVNNELHFGLVEGDAGEETLRVLAGDPFYSGIEPTGTTYPIDQVRLLAPIIPRSKVIGAIANWAGTEAPASPQFFLKPNTTVIGPGDPVTLPEYSEAVSAEGELAVIIGRIAKSVPLERVHEVIFGYTVANDLTARDLLEDRQWTRAKGFDGSTPLGPWIETDLDTDSLNITTWVDGDVVQEGNTSEMHYSVAEQVAAASEIFTLLPGDVILTGTPAGVSVLRDGNEVEVEVEGIGSLVTRVRDSAARAPHHLPSILNTPSRRQHDRVPRSRTQHPRRHPRAFLPLAHRHPARGHGAHRPLQLGLRTPHRR